MCKKTARKRGYMIFDTHAHYDDESFDEDREELLFSLKNPLFHLMVLLYHRTKNGEIYKEDYIKGPIREKR